MKQHLNKYAANIFSQFGEDGVISHIFGEIGVHHRVAVEFGAGDGDSCSNTAALWRNGWKGFLVEPDAERFELLEGNARMFDTIRRRAFVTPSGPSSISALLAEHNLTGIDFMSIDIDGDDYFILQHLECTPRVIAIEFNPTVPPHIELYPSEPGGTFGASLLAIIRLAERVGFTFVGATYCNAFLVNDDEAGPFTHYEKDPAVLLADQDYTYAVSDFAGRVVLCGEALPWGAREPYVCPLDGAHLTMTSDNPQHLRRGFEALWGPAQWIPPSWANLGDPQSAAPKLLERMLLKEQPQLVCLDISNQPALEPLRWIWELGAEVGYQVVTAGTIVGLVRR